LQLWGNRTGDFDGGRSIDSTSRWRRTCHNLNWRHYEIHRVQKKALFVLATGHCAFGHGAAGFVIAISVGRRFAQWCFAVVMLWNVAVVAGTAAHRMAGPCRARIGGEQQGYGEQADPGGEEAQKGTISPDCSMLCRPIHGGASQLK
jgi:hypothetical protein